MHEGHRERMYEKLKNGDDLFDHEVLEILLYSVVPRQNTNPTAHALLERFVTLYNVFNASAEELKEVDGVGDAVAKFIKTVGLCAERAGKTGNTPTIKTPEDCNRFIGVRLGGIHEERIEIYFLNSASKVDRIFSYVTNEKSRSAAPIDSIVRNFALYRPNKVIIAHNHTNDDVSPSAYDDGFTKGILFICNINGAQLIDHVICLSCGVKYSYRNTGRLEELNSLCSWENFVKWTKTLN